MLPLGTLSDDPPSGMEPIGVDDIGPYQLFEADGVNVLWWKFTAPNAGTYVFDGGLSRLVDGTPYGEVNENGETVHYLLFAHDPDDELEQGAAWSVLGDVHGTWMTLDAGQTVNIYMTGWSNTETNTGPVLLCLRATGLDGVSFIPARSRIEDAQVLGYASLTADGTVDLPLSVLEPDPLVDPDDPDPSHATLVSRNLLIMAAGESSLNQDIVIDGLVTNELGSPISRVVYDTDQATSGYLHSALVSQDIPTEGLEPTPGETTRQVTITFPEGVGVATVICMRWEFYEGALASQVTGTNEGFGYSSSVFAEDPKRVGPRGLPSVNGDGDYFSALDIGGSSTPGNDGATGGIAIFANYPDDTYAFDPLTAEQNLLLVDSIGTPMDYPDGPRFNPEGWRRLLPESPYEAGLAEGDLGRAFVFWSSQTWLQPRGNGPRYISKGLLEIGGPHPDTYTFVPYGTDTSIGGRFDISRARFT